MRTRLKPGAIGRARFLRSHPTDVERKLWYHLRALKRLGFHFRRQAPFRSYILDFVEHSRRVVIELDGGQHGDAKHKTRDEIRDRTLTAEGYLVLRFLNLHVLENIDGTVEYIISVLNSRPFPPPAPPARNALRRFDLPTRAGLSHIGEEGEEEGGLRRRV